MSGGLLGAVCQFEPEPGAPESNLDVVADLAARLPSETELAVFPELCTTGYVPETAVRLAETVPGPLTDRLSSIAAEHDVELAVGMPERADGDVYNALVLVDGRGVGAVYRKRHLWGDEADVFRRGEDPCVVDTAVGRVGLLVCYDLNFPEAALPYARQECDALLVSSAWRAAYRDDWRLLTRARAFEGTSYLLGVNHAGAQAGRVHGGRSFVVAPDGTVVEQAGDGRATATVEIDGAVLERARERNPVLQARREDSTGG